MACSVYAWGSNLHGEAGLEAHAGAQKLDLATQKAFGQRDEVVRGIGPFADQVKNRRTEDVQEFRFTGRGNDARFHTTPHLIPEADVQAMTRVFAGSSHSMGLDEFGNVWMWGRNKEGQLGNSSRSDSHKPAMVQGELASRRCISGACGLSTSAVITAEGELWEWGLVHFNPEEEEGGANHSTKMVGMYSEKARMSVRLRELLKASELLYLNGNQDQSLEKDGLVSMRTRRKIQTVPRLVKLDVRVSKVAFGSCHCLALSTQGKLFSKGYNDTGQLGDNSRKNRSFFAPVQFPQETAESASRIVDMACGYSHNLAVDVEGGLFSWGSNGLGQLGQGEQKRDQMLPRAIGFVDEGLFFLAVACGSYHSLALTRAGAVLSWGQSEYGQQGQRIDGGGDLGMRSQKFFLPQLVHPFLGTAESPQICEIHSGELYNLGVDTSGAVWAWGWNAFGVLGGGYEPGHHPRVVEAVTLRPASDSPVISTNGQISAGTNHVLCAAPPKGFSRALALAEILAQDCTGEFKLAGGRKANLFISDQDLGSFDLEIQSSKPSWNTRDKDVDAVIKAHRVVVFSRCPKLRQLWEAQGRGPKALISKSFPIRVLGAFVEYLYCDHVRSCPVHRFPTLKDLAQLVELPRLVQVCEFEQAKRRGCPQICPLLASTFPSDMRAALAMPEFADLTFELPAQAELPQQTLPTPTIQVKAHSALLCRQEFFRRLVSGRFAEAEAARHNQAISLHTIDAPTFQQLLVYVYTQEKDCITEENVTSLLVAAKQFVSNNQLVQACEAYLLDRVDNENAEELQIFAESFDLPKLRRTTLRSEMGKN